VVLLVKKGIKTKRRPRGFDGKRVCRIQPKINWRFSKDRWEKGGTGGEKGGTIGGRNRSFYLDLSRGELLGAGKTPQRRRYCIFNTNRSRTVVKKDVASGDCKTKNKQQGQAGGTKGPQKGKQGRKKTVRKGRGKKRDLPNFSWGGGEMRRTLYRRGVKKSPNKKGPRQKDVGRSKRKARGCSRGNGRGRGQSAGNIPYTLAALKLGKAKPRRVNQKAF